jgi:hypothetical protein
MEAATVKETTVKAIRRQLVNDGADPFQIAAVALARNKELTDRVHQLERLLRR